MREPIVKFLRRNLIELAVEFGDRVDAVGTAAVGLVQVVVLYVELLVVNNIVGSFPRRSVVVADHVVLHADILLAGLSVHVGQQVYGVHVRADHLVLQVVLLLHEGQSTVQVHGVVRQLALAH